MRRLVRAIYVALVVSLAAAPAFAQSDVPRNRGYRGLFAATNSPQPPKLELRWSLAGISDDNVTSESFGTSGGDPRSQVGGSHGAAGAVLQYTSRKTNSSLAAKVSSNGNYYPNLKELNAFDGIADLTYGRELGRSGSTKLALYQGVQYRPYFQMDFLGGLTPSDGGAPPRDIAVTLHDSYEYQGRMEVSKSFDSRGVVAFEYGHRSTWYSDAIKPFRWHTGNAKYSLPFTRFAALRLGYGLGKAQDGLAGTNPIVTQNIDAGIEYNRPLSPTRRTGYTFTSGSSVVDYEGTRYYRVLGEASLTRELGRSWNARVSYNRGLQLAEGIAGPLYADTVQTRLGGYIGRRVDLSITGGYSNGQVGLGSADPGYVTYSALAGGRFALTRTLAIESQYVYYKYDFEPGARLPENVPGTLDRRGFRLGLTGWLPLSR